MLLVPFPFLTFETVFVIAEKGDCDCVGVTLLHHKLVSHIPISLHAVGARINLSSNYSACLLYLARSTPVTKMDLNSFSSTSHSFCS